jgi:hypothetical protein
LPEISNFWQYHIDIADLLFGDDQKSFGGGAVEAKELKQMQSDV